MVVPGICIWQCSNKSNVKISDVKCVPITNPTYYHWYPFILTHLPLLWLDFFLNKDSGYPRKNSAVVISHSKLYIYISPRTIFWNSKFQKLWILFQYKLRYLRFKTPGVIIGNYITQLVLKSVSKCVKVSQSV